MTTVNDWINADPQRRAPEFDFGTQWTREHDPTTEWAVTYNTGTGELYARTRDGSDVEVLGQFADPQDVADALPDWGRRSMQPGSLDWVRREALALERSQPTVADDDPVYAVVLGTDGERLALRSPQSIGDVAIRLDAPDLDVARVNTGDRTDRVLMWVDDNAHRDDLPVNAAATQLYGTGWPILGNAVVVTDDKSPLPPALVNDLVGDIETPDYQLDVASLESRPLDWEEHHRDREAQPDSDVEVDLEVAELAYLDEDLQPDLLRPDDPEPDVDDPEMGLEL